jgi:hypothetical protein
LKKIPIFNQRDKKNGFIIDIVIYSDNTFSLVISDYFLIPKSAIKEITLKKVKTSVLMKKELESLKQFCIKHNYQ